MKIKLFNKRCFKVKAVKYFLPAVCLSGLDIFLNNFLVYFVLRNVELFCSPELRGNKIKKNLKFCKSDIHSCNDNSQKGIRQMKKRRLRAAKFSTPLKCPHSKNVQQEEEVNKCLYEKLSDVFGQALALSRL